MNKAIESYRKQNMRVHFADTIEDISSVTNSAYTAEVNRSQLNKLFEKWCGDDIHNCGFLFALPKNDTKYHQDDMNLYSIIEKASEVHFVFFSHYQAYCVKTGVNPHGTLLFKNFYEAIQAVSSGLSIYVYLPEQSYSNDYLVVINNCSYSSIME